MAEPTTPPSVFNPASGQLETPSSISTSDPSTSSSGGTTRKRLTDEQIEALAKVDAANAAVNAAASPAAPLDMRTGADVAADAASQDQSAQPAQTLRENGLVPVPAGQPNANMPYSSQDFAASTEGAGLVGGIKGPQTVQQATDENAVYQAQAQARIARETEERQQAIEAERQRRVDAGMQRLNQAAGEYEQKSKLTSYKEDHGMFHNILSALAVGMGAYGAAITHSPNFALEIINKEMDQDMERKKLAMESAFNKYKQAGMAPQQIEEWAKQQHANLLAKQQAQLATVEKLGAKSLAPFPQAQQAFLQAAAERKAKQAKDNLDFVKESTGLTNEFHTANEGQKRTVVNALGKGEEGKSAGQDVVAKSALEDAKANQKYLASLSDDEYKEITQQKERGTAAAEHNKKALQGGIVDRAGAKLSQGAYDATGGLIGSPASGYQAVKDVAGEDGEAFISRDQKATSAVVGLTNQKAAANPGALEELAKDKGASTAGLSRAEAMRRNAENIKILEAETDRLAKPLAKIEVNAAKREGRALPVAATAAPLSGKDLTKLSTKERKDYVDAKLTKPSSPDYPGAQAAIRQLEAKARGGR
jgi:hypothetical protein